MARFDKFGEFLLEKNVVTRKALSGLLASQRLVREKIGTIAVKEGFLTEEELAGYLSEFLGIPLLNHEVEIIEKGIIKTIPKKIALKAEVLPVGTGEKGELLLLCAGPVQMALLQNISRLANRQVKLVLTTSTKLKKMQNLFYTMEYDTSISLNDRIEVESIGFAIELLEKIMLRAINKGASDIHVEPGMDELVIRFRVDGMLIKTETLPYDLCSKLISRIKVMAGLDIAERRKPQDGAFYFKPQTLDVDIEGVNVRVSVIPAAHGEKAVLRLLPPHDEAIHLDSLGMQPELLESFKKYLRSPHGIVLVTGPTGSGKSTTLYGSMQRLRSETTNITTIEDPVELTIRGLTQTQVDSGENITFAKAMRAILRQDPDIIMVGEIRDIDTLRVSLQAAITGHLVLSTLHTNDAPSAFSRLMDMGAEPFLVAASVRAVLAQRLVRVVCSYCSEWTDISDAELSMLGIKCTERFKVRRGKGCDFCNNKGYRGRIGIYELLCVDDAIKKMVMEKANFEEIRTFARKEKGFKTLREDGISKVRKGITTPEEIMRVTME
ncbi:MAG TPA: secretion system protein E [Proteobacteria bacterium]|nr:secretion system protein E [Pseudomonadota bacterium]